jgi:hypothetical protein
MTPRSVYSASVLVGVLMSLVVAVGTPPWEANDEGDHLHNVQTLVAGSCYRVTDKGSGLESHQPPLYYLLLAGWQRYFLHFGPLTFSPVGARSFGNAYRHDVPSDGAAQRYVTLMRLVSVLLACVTVVLTRHAVCLLTSDPWTPVVAAAFVFGNPKFVFLSGVVNNDNLANALGAATLLVTATFLGQRQAGRPVLLAGISGALIGLLMLTKVTAALLAPAAVLGIFVAPSMGRSRWLLLLSFVTSAIGVSGWWLLLNTLRYGDPLATAATRGHLRSLLPLMFAVGSPIYQILVSVPSSVFRSFWYVSRENQLFWLSRYPYAVLWLGLALGVGGLFRRRVPLSVPAGTLAVLGVAVIGGAAAIWIVGLEANTAQARIGFFALPALGSLYALGVQRWRLAIPLRFALPMAGIALTWIAIIQHVVGLFPN